MRSTKGVFDGPTANNTPKLKITEEEKKRFQQMVQKAATLAEVQKLEKMYNEGRLPTGGDVMDET